MGLLRTLLGAIGSSGDPEQRMRSLATLLVTELRMYNLDPLETTPAGPRLRPEVARDLIRAYETYREQVGVSEQAAAIFRARAAEALTDGDEEAVAAVLEEAESGPPPPLRPS